MALITNENVNELVKMYFEVHRRPNTTFKEKCKLMYESQAGSGKLKMSDIYHIFWAIRILSETGKYDNDDIEFQVRKNPIFAEIPTDDYDDKLAANDKHATPEQATPEHATPEQATPEQATPEQANETKPKQVALLRQAIEKYQ